MKIVDNTSPLISALELQPLLNKKNVKVFDIRGNWGAPPVSNYDDYLKGHIPTAIYLDWTKYFLQQDLPIGLAPIASKKDAQKAFKELGISETDLVVLYDDYHHMLAGRIWWAMRYWGFSNVKVLNGGWQYWIAEDFPTTTTIGYVEEGRFLVSERSDLSVGLEHIKNRADNVSLIDARGPVNYGGDPSKSDTGHIPGAINIPYFSVLDDVSGLFKNEVSIRAIFNKKISNIDRAKLISSCGSGYAGTVILIALKVLGIDAALFDGSFSVWKESGNLAIEQGPIQ